MTFDELKALLFARSNFGMKLGLERMQAALALLGNPHRCAPVLHVAGTNGKGSTCAFTEAALRAAGLKTGLTTSPHLVHFCERIRVGGEPISEETACALLEELLARVPWALHDDDGLTFFELTTLLAFLAFANAGVDVQVVEVGLGGRLDATNVVEPLAVAIAPLGLDHLQYLGPTLAHVAAEKAGIVKPGTVCVSAGQPAEAARVLAQACTDRGATLWRPGRDYRFESREGRPFCYQRGWTVRPARLALLGHHQRGNAALACALLEAASERGLRVTAEHAARGLETARWPGRLERIAEQPLTLVDGAHNEHATRALAATLASFAPRVELVVGVLADKDVRALLGPLLPFAAAVHCCAPASPRALAADALAAIVREALPGVPVAAYASATEALSAARNRAGANGTVLACGSLFLAGELLEHAQGRALSPMPAERL